MSEIIIKQRTDPAGSGSMLNQLLEKLYLHTHCDFRQYKVSSISRRVERRLRVTGTESCEAYINYLNTHPDEYHRLLDSLTIHVTDFFRDTEPWEILRADVFPDLLSQAAGHQPLRLWSAGCATGQEAYSAAILLDELNQTRKTPTDFEIYATDIDRGCLAKARAGWFGPDCIGQLSDDIAEFCFDNQSGHILPHIQKKIRFLQHDLVLDPPLMEMDCIMCRNVAIYFSRDLQEHLFRNFYRSLRTGGYLFLGKAESLSGDLARQFIPVNTKWKIYRKQ